MDALVGYLLVLFIPWAPVIVIAMIIAGAIRSRRQLEPEPLPVRRPLMINGRPIRQVGGFSWRRVLIGLAALVGFLMWMAYTGH